MSLLNINKLSVNVPDEFSKKAIEFAKEIWTGMPKWLRNLLVVTVVMGALYFLYNRIAMSFDVAELHTDVAILNERCEKTVFYDRYQYDVSNVVSTVKTLLFEFKTIIDFNKELLDILQELHQDSNLDDKFYRLRKRYRYEMEQYSQIIQYQINMYEEWLKEQPANNFLINKNKNDSDSRESSEK